MATYLLCYHDIFIQKRQPHGGFPPEMNTLHILFSWHGSHGKMLKGQVVFEKKSSIYELLNIIILSQVIRVTQKRWHNKMHYVTKLVMLVMCHLQQLLYQLLI